MLIFMKIATDITEAVQLLESGELVSFPTETVYGLGANCFNEAAVAKIFIAKGRPQDNPLIIHVSSMKMLQDIVGPVGSEFLGIYSGLIQKYWPGPLTLLFPKGNSIPSIVNANGRTMAVRMPNNPTALALIKACGFPLAAPSANTSGRPSPTLAAHVQADLDGKIQLVIDGGPCNSGVESTVLDGTCLNPVILRPGAITLEMIKSFPGFEKTTVWRNDPLDTATPSPGMKYRHYRPDCEVILVSLANASELSRTVQSQLIQDKANHYYSKYPNQVGIIRTSNQMLGKDSELNLYLGSEPEDIARGLYKSLRDLEALGVKVIIIQGIIEDNGGLAIMNRLSKAATEII